MPWFYYQTYKTSRIDQQNGTAMLLFKQQPTKPRRRRMYFKHLSRCPRKPLLSHAEFSLIIISTCMFFNPAVYLQMWSVGSNALVILGTGQLQTQGYGPTINRSSYAIERLSGALWWCGEKKHDVHVRGLNSFKLISLFSNQEWQSPT